MARPVAILRRGDIVSVLDIDPSISDAQAQYQALRYGLDVDSEVFDATEYADPPGYPCDGRVATMQELDNMLRDMP